MLQSLEEMSVYLEDPTLSFEEEDRIIRSSIKICLTLMAGYPSTMFSSDEQNFVSDYLNKLKKITNKNLDNNSDPDYYG
jgi:hypothetical protein